MTFPLFGHFVFLRQPLSIYPKEKDIYTPLFCLIHGIQPLRKSLGLIFGAASLVGEPRPLPPPTEICTENHLEIL